MTNSNLDNRFETGPNDLHESQLSIELGSEIDLNGLAQIAVKWVGIVVQVLEMAEQEIGRLQLQNCAVAEGNRRLG